MGSKPITAIAKMKSYENSVAKSILDPKKPKSVEEDVRDENNNLLRGEASFSFGPDKVSINRQEQMRNLTDADVWNTNRNNVQGKYGDFKSYQTAAQTYRDEQGESFTPAQIGTGEFTEIVNRKPGDLLTKFAYKPQTQEVDTETLRQGRRINRNVKGSGRRAEGDDRRADNLERRLNKLKEKGKEDTNRYKRLERKYNIKRRVADASKARFERNVGFSESGVNPYNTRRTEQNKKASEDTQTKSEFESKFGGNNLGIQEIKSFTPGSIKFSTPTMPTFTNTGANFQGAGSYLTQMANDNPKAVGTKRGYKMSGYGTKNK